MGGGGGGGGGQAELQFEVGEIERALYARVVKKCGNRNHWEDWANDIAAIANTHITRITTIVNDPRNKKEVAAFTAFADELRDDLNDSINNEEVIEMLAQHLITRPVFEALFSDYSFASNNPVSQAMQRVLDILQEHHLDKEAGTLEKFYASVQMRAEGIDNAQGKQKIVVELYDKFFRNAFPKMTDRLGIVYTPVEVVDFIIHSVNELLQKEFNQRLGSEGVHIIDPFVGTGTFITRLLQSGLIDKEQLPHKYKNEIHANEIVLLAYYIAAINIEAVYHSLVGGEYQPYEGICLTDTFQLYEKEDLISELLVDNSDRRKHQKELDIRVIVGNPPYSTGQKSVDDNNQNITYGQSDSRIRDTYGKYSTATNQRNLFDSYIRAIRWASDRVGDSGIIGFVSGSGFVEKLAMNGVRKCLTEEFNSIYVFNLRGDIRKNMMNQGRAGEGQNIFGSGSMTGIAISILVKNPGRREKGKIYYADIGDDLTTQEKLEIIKNTGGVNGVSRKYGWDHILPDDHNDWIGQRDISFDQFIKIGEKRERNVSKIFNNYSLGIVTNRDAWCYKFSKKSLSENMNKMIDFYNSEVSRYESACHNLDKKDYPKIEEIITTDTTKINWTRKLKQELSKFNKYAYDDKKIIKSMYRPFCKQWLYFDKAFNESQRQMPRIFPDELVDNKVIHLSGAGSMSGFSVLITDTLPDMHHHDCGQCFPLYLYDGGSNSDSDDLFSTSENEQIYKRTDGVSDGGLAHFQSACPEETISKEDIFYYVYGLLHSREYRGRYANNLSKELPRIPCVKKVKKFWVFSKAGRDLADLHINYETMDCYPVKLEKSSKSLSNDDYKVEKMKFVKKSDKSTVVYNHNITIKDIPLEAYDYMVNGKPALEWVMERQVVTKDKKSGIVNNANLWAAETMGNSKYPLELFQRVITVSLETMKIVNALPKLDID